VQLFNIAAADPNHPIYRELQYFSVNPMKGDGRADDNVTKYRNFLIEFDKIALEQQIKGVAECGMPYSTATFSGSKSIHYIISLEEALPNRELYDFVVEWIYNILEPYSVDTQTKNPSRFSRVPGGTNEKIYYQVDESGQQIEDKRGYPIEDHRSYLEQKLLKVNGRVPNDKLQAWLLAHPECQPKPKVYDRTTKLSDTADASLLSNWTRHLLANGIHNGKRNAEVFKMGFDFIKCGFSLEEACSYFCQHAKNLGDFTIGEAEMALQSAYKTYARRSQ
jgi:hypothetical protein